MESLGKFPYLASFIAGILTFISPCILPLIPAYISFITGASIDELKKEGKSFWKIFLNSVFFVIGFSVVFILLGATASYLGNFVSANKDVIRWVGGIIVIIFGVHITGLISIPFLNLQKKIQIGKVSLDYFGAFIMGVTFAVGWTPCIGPILSSILILASTQGSVGEGTLLLVFYSIGIGVPFLLTAVFINWALIFFSKIRKYYKIIEIISGIILIMVGIMIITDSLNRLSGYFLNIFG